MDQELQAGLDHLDGQIKAFISRHENQKQLLTLAKSTPLTPAGFTIAPATTP